MVHALIKAGWQIVAESFRYLRKRRIIYIDIIAQQGDRLIHVEVKCFEDPDTRPDDEYHAVGQYLMCQAFFEQFDIDTVLYLAIPVTIYAQADDVFRRELAKHQIKLLLFDEVAEEVVQWIETN